MSTTLSELELLGFIPLKGIPELRFPDEDGPWSMKCFLESEGFSVRLYMNDNSVTPRRTEKFDFLQTFDQYNGFNQEYLTFRLFLGSQGLDHSRLSPKSLQEMCRPAWMACMVRNVMRQAHAFSEHLSSDMVVEIWRNEEIRRLMAV